MSKQQGEQRDECVILAHGLSDYKTAMWGMERALRACGFAVVNWSYASLTHSLTTLAHRLHEVYTMNAPHYTRIHFVGHSMGGLVARRLMKLYNLEKVGKLVMIGTPNNGAALARALLDHPTLKQLFAAPPVRWVLGPSPYELKDPDYINAVCALPTCPVLVIAGTKSSVDLRNLNSLTAQRVLEPPHDGTVALAETRLPHMDAMIEVYETHPLLTTHPRVIEETWRFLADQRDTSPEEITPTISPLQRQLWLVAKTVGWFDRDIHPLGGLPTMPNLPLKASSRALFWRDIVCCSGWRVQEHVMLGSFRLLNPQGVRHSWGGKRAVLRAFHEVVEGERRED